MREFGSEFDLDSNNDFIVSGINQPFFEGVNFFRSGRDALKAIAVKYKGFNKRILLPALCCESMVNPFQENGYEVSYFKLNPDLSANTQDIFSKLQSADVFLYMNYFGIQSLTDGILQLIRERFHAIVIEDTTHDILSPRCNEFIPDYIIGSIRKWVAIPDGGLLFSKDQFEVFVKEEDAFFSDIRTEALKNKSLYLKSGNLQLKELFRSQLVEANEYLSNDKSVIGMSPRSAKIMERMDFKKIAKVRHENFLVLAEGLKDMVGIKQLGLIVSKVTGNSIDNAPGKVSNTGPNSTILYYPIIVDSRDKLQKTLADSGIYCPVIWPLPKNAVSVCEVSDYISNHMLALPCDQRYGTSEIGQIIASLKKIVGA